MSRLWSITLIILALGLGFIAGILLVMFVFVMPRERDAGSGFFQHFNFPEVLRQSSPKDTQWDVIDSGTPMGSYNRSGAEGRSYLAECKMPNATDQTMLQTLLTTEIQKLMTPYKGMIYSTGGISRVTPAPTPGATGAVPLSNIRFQTTMPYTVGTHTGFVHLTIISEGEKVIVNVVMHED